jgi:hypothetical protein
VSATSALLISGALFGNPFSKKKKSITIALYYPTVLLSFLIIKEHDQIALEKIQAWVENLTRAAQDIRAG